MCNGSHSSNVIVTQPALPSYRLGFFEAVNSEIPTGFNVFSSDMSLGILTDATKRPKWARPLGPIKQLLPGVEWQVGALSIPITRGDVIVVSGNPRCLSNIALLIWARLRGAKTIWWGQLWSATTRMHRYVLRLLLMRLAHGVIFYTDAEVEAYRTSHWGHRDRRKISALNNGIDVEPIKLLRRAYNPEKRGANILFIGRLTEKADLGLLLQAMTEPKIAHVTLHVIGDGPQARPLKDWATHHGLDGRVIWHDPTVDEAQIANVANRCAVFCYPGGVGLSLIHAMAYGLPAMVHDDRSKHMPEIAAFKEDVTGREFTKDDKQSLSYCLAELLNDPESRAEMSRDALSRADTIYNTSAMAERFLDCIKYFR